MTAGRLGLRARITLVTVAVAVLAVLVTGAVSLQLVRQSSNDDARRQLAAQATILAKLPTANSVDDLQNRVTIALGATEAGIVSASGQVSGPAADLLPERLVRRAAIGSRVSTTVNGPDGATLIEIRPKRGGGSLVLALPRSTVDAQARGALGRIGLSLLIGLAVAVIAGLLLARWLAKPLVSLARSARRIAHGERGVVAHPGGPPEAVEVSDALATLDAALTTSEQRQREFLLSISHELRTPLTALRGYAEAIADGIVPAENLPGVGQVLIDETTRLNAFVTDLLELARLEADDFSITPEEVRIDDLLRASRNAWLGRATPMGVELAVESQPMSIRSDPQRLRQLVDGLVENALRVSPEGSRIRLAAWAEGGDAVIEVRDAGPGFAPGDAEVAFERGALHERYRDSRPVGTGLGLSIAARLVTRLGGDISAATAVDGGAVFTVRIRSAAREG